MHVPDALLAARLHHVGRQNSSQDLTLKFGAARWCTARFERYGLGVAHHRVTDIRLESAPRNLITPQSLCSGPAPGHVDIGSPVSWLPKCPKEEFNLAVGAACTHTALRMLVCRRLVGNSLCRQASISPDMTRPGPDKLATRVSAHCLPVRVDGRGDIQVGVVKMVSLSRCFRGCFCFLAI